jgi:hypothetical protein
LDADPGSLDQEAFNQLPKKFNYSFIHDHDRPASSWNLGQHFNRCDEGGNLPSSNAGRQMWGL